MKMIGVLAIGFVTLYAQVPVFESATIKREPSVAELASQISAAPRTNAAPPGDPAPIGDPAPPAPVVELNLVRDGTLNLRSISLMSLIQMAYRVHSYQLAGVSDLGQDRFEVVAKIPDGISAEQLPEMLQRLLADRFRLIVHRETRETPGYVLVIAKDGLGVNGSVLTPRGMVRPEWGDRLPVVLADGPSGSARFRVAAGAGWLEMSGMTMGTVALTLTSLLDVPVVDQTGLAGTYEIVLQWPSQGLLGIRRGMLHQLGDTRAGSAAALMDDDSAAAAVLDALGNVGLTLEPRREPIEVVVIDSLQKTPTDN